MKYFMQYFPIDYFPDWYFPGADEGGDVNVYLSGVSVSTISGEMKVYKKEFARLYVRQKENITEVQIRGVVAISSAANYIDVKIEKVNNIVAVHVRGVSMPNKTGHLECLKIIDYATDEENAILSMFMVA